MCVVIHKCAYYYVLVHAKNNVNIYMQDESDKTTDGGRKPKKIKNSEIGNAEGMYVLDLIFCVI